MKNHSVVIFLLTLCFSIVNLQAQNLNESRRTSYLTYVYELSDNEAINIYKKGLEKVDESYFHTLIHTYPTDSAVDLNLKSGHYLVAWADHENLNFELLSQSNLEVKILNNGADMNLILHDLSGAEVIAERLSIDGKKIPFNKSTKSYFLKGSNKRGLLEINYEGVKTFTFISREFNNSKFRRFSRKILYSVPLKYLSIPVSMVLLSPYDLFRSVKVGRPTGIFYSIVKPFRDIVHSIRWGNPQGVVEKVFCVFDHWYCVENRYDGYLVFNKPKYLPGDTVKFKAFVTNKKGSPIKKNAEITLSGRNGFKTKQILKALSPYRKGAFEYEFALHDSLDLLLDNTYTISLANKRSNVYIKGQFEYEDYELKSNHYEFRADKENHFQGQDVSLYASGTDINGLNLFDVQMHLVVLTRVVDETFDDQVLVPDTLWTYDQKLENIAETKVMLPDSIFPKANFTYEVKATFLNAENERREKTINLSYSYRREQVVFDAVRDSLVISKKRNGEEIPARVDLRILNGEFDEIESMALDLPVKIKINPFAHIYRLDDEENTEKWRLKNVPSQLQVLSTRDSDSLSIGVENPRKLFFRYFIYEENKEIHKGSGTDLKFEFKNRVKGKYFISIHYVWADEIVSENYEVNFKDKQLKIKVFEPGIIYPGQEAEIKVLVQDASGKAVENADLSAFAFTKKFEESRGQSVPYFGKTYKDRTLINNFEDKLTALSDQTETRLLDWQLWNARMHLDSIEFYKFLYPVLNYSSTLPVPDSITQFSPYLVKEGKIQPIYIIYVDNRPVYFSVSSEVQRYSFVAEPGYHQIRLRMSSYEAIVDSLYFEKGVKNIFSFLMDTANHRIKLVKRPLSLTDHENKLVSGHLIAIENNVRFTAPTYLKQDSKIFWINEQGNSQRNYLLGPVYAKETSYVRSGKDTLDFDLEQNYHYSFQRNFIKMKKNENIYYSKFLTDVSKAYPLNEVVLTEKEIKKINDEKKNLKQATGRSFINPAATKTGHGKLQVLVDGSQLKDKFVKNIIVLKDDEPQFFRVYSGLNNKIFHDLVPGVYSTYILFDNNSYLRRKNIRIDKNALTLINMLSDSLREADNSSDLINGKIREMQEDNSYYFAREEGSKEIRDAILKEERINRYSGKTIFGVVRDRDEGDPLPGVTVIIKGTQIGTITNIDGEYSIKVSENYSTLLVSFVGYVTDEVKIGNSQELNVTLTPDVMQLSEVVVVGFGAQERRSLTGSVTTIEASGLMSRSLQGRVAGVSVDGGPGSNTNIQIRGLSALNAESTPLYVVNGVPYSGKELEISPDMIERIEVLNSDAATSIYGSRAINGVILITLKDGAEAMKTILSNNTFMEALENSSSIRNNFSDYAYWEPRLRTDENGFASFKVKFPDDITAWKTHVLGMSEKKQSGQYEGEIKSFKTVAGTLATPAFLIAGDTTSLIGKVLNYTSDSLDVDMSFEADSVLLYAASHNILNSKIDTLRVIAPLAADSVSFQYKITKADGYFDGELRSVPVLKKGVQETSGQFFVLENDTTFNYTLPFNNQTFSVTASANVLQVLMDEADHIRRYEYLCNEQIASKVKALIALKTINEFQDEHFKYENLVKRLIKDLYKNQKNGLWGWWPESSGNYWISLHVLEALLNAEKHGYKIDIERQVVIDRLVYNLEIRENAEKIRILKMLSLLNAPFAYKEHLDSLEKSDLRFAEFAQVQLLKQKLDLPYALDSLLKLQKETMFGGIYWEEAEDKVYRNSVISTLYVYDLIKNSKRHEKLLPKIRNYFLETRRSLGYWRNTYESANILTTILPDLLKKDERYTAPVITINGIENKDSFPVEKIYDDAQQVNISKTGTGPVYLSIYQQFWNEAPDKVEEELVITTSFENDTMSFKAGQQESMNVKLDISKDAEYIMLEIPIPAGFSYVNKAKQPLEEHREYYKHKVNIYFSSLKAGSYDIKIELLPRFSGNYAVNPAKAELMYFPVFFGRNDGKRIEVR